MEQWNLVAETREWVGPLTVTINGTVVSNFVVAITEGAARPTTWVTPDVDPDPPGTAHGVLVGVDTPFPLTAGKKYTLWTRFTDNPEQPAQRTGLIKVT